MNKFIPKNYKFKKIRKSVRNITLKETRSNVLKHGDYGLKILNNGVISHIVLEAARRAITRKLKRTGNLKINGFSSIPITAKPLGVRMGKGVGSISKWVLPIKKGKILFELGGVSSQLAKTAFRSAAFKLPLKSKFIFI